MSVMTLSRAQNIFYARERKLYCFILQIAMLVTLKRTSGKTGAKWLTFFILSHKSYMYLLHRLF